MTQIIKKAIIIGMNSNSIFAAENSAKWLYPKYYYKYIYTGFSMPFHEHKTTEIMYVLYGVITVEFLNDCKTESRQIRSNEYIFLDAGVSHRLIVDKTARIYNIEMEPGWASGTKLFRISSFSHNEPEVKNFFAARPAVAKIIDDGSFIKALSGMQDYIGGDNSKRDTYIDLAMASILFLIALQYNSGFKRASGEKYLVRAVQYITENYTEEITVKALAQSCGVSQNYLNLLFRKKYGLSAGSYINKYRVSRAAILLAQTDTDIESILKSSGFNNKQNFYKNFSKYMKYSPKRYRDLENIKEGHMEL